MAQYTLIKMTHMTPLHVGTGKENYDFSDSWLHSDTLSAALASMRALLGRTSDLKDFLDSFSISSAFPYFGEAYFLPLPSGKLNIQVDDMEEYSSRKKLKKLLYAESSLWNHLVAGQQLTVHSCQLFNEFLIPHQSVASFQLPYLSQVRKRLVIPRDGLGDAVSFFFNWTYFNNLGGLYCLLDTDKVHTNEIKSLFQQLGLTGIGSDKNVGGGKFDVEFSSLTLPEVPAPNASMLLSLYIPQEGEIASLNLHQSRYALIKRNGFIAGSSFIPFRHLHKNSVMMFGEGSVFPTTAALSGTIVDLRPQWNDPNLHPVYRSGKPFAVQIKDSINL